MKGRVQFFFYISLVGMDWSKVANVPKYNPMMFTLVRHLEGLAKWEFAKKAELTTKRLSEIESGDDIPTEDEVDKIFKAQSHVLRDFFMQWHEYETIFHAWGGVPKQINYYKFRIFREVNPPPLSIVN